jgi:hypothetical protein
LAVCEKEITVLIDLKQFTEHDKKEVKEKITILDLEKDLLIMHIAKKKIDKEMYDTSIELYQDVNISRKMLSRNKI